jgi:hypothetical protein
MTSVWIFTMLVDTFDTNLPLKVQWLSPTSEVTAGGLAEVCEDEAEELWQIIFMPHYVYFGCIQFIKDACRMYTICGNGNT